jgi:hypothetical protein
MLVMDTAIPIVFSLMTVIINMQQQITQSQIDTTSKFSSKY